MLYNQFVDCAHFATDTQHQKNSHHADQFYYLSHDKLSQSQLIQLTIVPVEKMSLKWTLHICNNQLPSLYIYIIFQFVCCFLITCLFSFSNKCATWAMHL